MIQFEEDSEPVVETNLNELLKQQAKKKVEAKEKK